MDEGVGRGRGGGWWVGVGVGVGVGWGGEAGLVCVGASGEGKRGWCVAAGLVEWMELRR